MQENPDQTQPQIESNWGALPQEPCRFCHEAGGVQFLIDDSPFGKNAAQVMQCTRCGRTWESQTGQVGA